MAGLRVAFMGSPDLGVPCLEALAAAPDVDLLAAVSMGDRRRGRGGAPVPTPVGRAAIELGVDLLRWERGGGREIRERLELLALDAIVVIAFARILKPRLLALPRLGCLNLHASLLPWGRGASPIQQAILEGLATSGWSAMKMDEGLDTGPVLATLPCAVGPRWTAGEFYAALRDAAPAFLLDSLRGWAEGSLSPAPQPEAGASYAPRIEAAAGAIDWAEPATLIDRKIRAYDPAPGTWCARDGARLGVLAAEPVADAAGGEPGQVLQATPRALRVACGEGALDLTRLRPEGGKPMDAAAYLNGRPLAPGARLERG